jgi:uncharacterized Zn-binding protein involved in type VI secretion
MTAKRVIIKGDPVSGSDTHEVGGSGVDPNTGATVTGTWKGDYSYDGTMTGALSDLVTIHGAPVALDDSRSSLRSDSHLPASGTNFSQVPPTTPPVPNTALPLSFTKTVGTGAPTAAAGSSFVTVRGKAVLLHGDTLDTCGDERGSGNSSVNSAGQSFVTVTE